MSAQHTPGPWEWDGTVWQYDSEQESPWLVQAPWRNTASKTILGGSIRCQSEADARLIAKAPEMLEALKDAYPYIADDALRERVGNLIADATGVQA
jgi:hypothetical protein